MEFKTELVTFKCYDDCMETSPCKHRILLNNEEHVWSAPHIISFYKKHNQSVPQHFLTYDDSLDNLISFDIPVVNSSKPDNTNQSNSIYIANATKHRIIIKIRPERYKLSFKKYLNSGETFYLSELRGLSDKNIMVSIGRISDNSIYIAYIDELWTSNININDNTDYIMTNTVREFVESP